MCEHCFLLWLLCVRVCNVKPETAEVHGGPTAASELHEGNHQHGNTRRLWLHEEAPSWEQKREGRREWEGLHGICCWVLRVNIERVSLRVPNSLTFKCDDTPLHRLPFSGPYSLQHPHGCCGLTLKALTDVISVGPGPILKQHLSGLAGPGQRLQQVLHLIGGATTGQIWTRLQRNSRVESRHKEVSTQEISPPSLLPCCLNKEWLKVGGQLASQLCLFLWFLSAVVK